MGVERNPYGASIMRMITFLGRILYMIGGEGRLDKYYCPPSLR